ncbi:hypothetical protein PFISCL1PPCAC_15619 [Pristionchus fissidentatus]|uniref:Uncharacterized protein n=1 Tax=Pristionchus fissidentatus TaxID=1538716 RepID=A0AAV5VXH2_9BILA|nr:hypothetical protein PFISCL1PPCAC_15619 [Pristionchus fissidentatus]
MDQLSSAIAQNRFTMFRCPPDIGIVEMFPSLCASASRRMTAQGVLKRVTMKTAILVNDHSESYNTWNSMEERYRGLGIEFTFVKGGPFVSDVASLLEPHHTICEKGMEPSAPTDVLVSPFHALRQTLLAGHINFLCVVIDPRVLQAYQYRYVVYEITQFLENYQIDRIVFIGYNCPSSDDYYTTPALFSSASPTKAKVLHVQ